MRNFFPAIQNPDGELISLSDGTTLMTESQDNAMHAMAVAHLDGVPLRQGAELVVVRVSNDEIVRKYNRETKRWESTVIRDDR